MLEKLCPFAAASGTPIAVDSRDVEQFERDGFVALRGAFDPGVAAECRESIWNALATQGVSRDPATWTRPVPRVACPEGGPFEAAGTIDGSDPPPVARAIVAGLNGDL